MSSGALLFMMSGSTRLPLATKLSYGVGSVAYGVKDQGFQTLLLIYYNQVLGLPAAMVSLALMLALVIDAFFDPVVGHVSDNWRSKLGRRHPFMYVAAIPICVTFFLVWNPPSLTGGALFAYLVASAVSLRFCLSLYEIPNASLLPELTQDYTERTSLFSYRYFFAIVGSFGMAAAAFAVFLAPTPEFPVGQLNPQGYREYSWAAIGLMAVSMTVSILGTQRIARQFHSPARRRMDLRAVFAEMLATLSNRALLVMTGVGIFSGLANGLYTALGVYLGTFYWGLDSKALSILSTAALAGIVLSVVTATPLTRTFGKKRTTLAALIVAVAFLVIPVACRESGVFPPNGSPWLLALLFAERAFSLAAGMTAVITGASMVADIVEDVELKTGRRAEGLLQAANTFVQKTVSGLGIMAAGLILSIVKFPEGAKPGAASATVLSHLAQGYMGAVLFFYALSIGCLMAYPISREGHEGRLRELARRAAAE